MCDDGEDSWSCEVKDGYAVIWEYAWNRYGGEMWTQRAAIPIKDAVKIAATLMAHRKRGFDVDAVLAMEGG